MLGGAPSGPEASGSQSAPRAHTAVPGMSFIDVVVGTGIMLVVFLSIFGAYKLAIELVYNTKARVGGMALVSKQLEYMRSLPYDQLGTVGGIPTGAIPQLATTTLNNIPYTVRTLIIYKDDPADGAGAADSNSITADYKELKVEVVWIVRGRSYSTLAVTRVAPHGIESLTSGGTLRVNVFDAVAAPIQGASVRIRNASTTPAIDVTVYTDSTGSVALPGAPQASNYKVTATKDGYSTAQTYDSTNQNPNPNPAHISVANQQTTTISFAIDRIGSLDVQTYSPVAVGYSQGAFDVFNMATTTSVAPPALVSWDSLSWSGNVPQDTALTVQVLYPTGGDYALVPDAVLPGNSTGLSNSASLALIATSTFPTLLLKATVDPSVASTSPVSVDWRIDYHAGPSPIPNVGFTMYGTKTIGTSISGAPIYKFVQTNTTSQIGTWLITPLEWDTYTLALTGATYDISEICPAPVAVAPGENRIASLLLVPKSAHSLRVEVMANNVLVPGATVSLTNPGNKSTTSSLCGQAFFEDLSVTTYTLTVSKSGYPDSVQSVPVAGATVVTVPLTQ